jgi:hypothetical protein
VEVVQRMRIAGRVLVAVAVVGEGLVVVDMLVVVGW